MAISEKKSTPCRCQQARSRAERNAYLGLASRTVSLNQSLASFQESRTRDRAHVRRSLLQNSEQLCSLQQQAISDSHYRMQERPRRDSITWHENSENRVSRVFHHRTWMNSFWMNRHLNHRRRCLVFSMFEVRFRLVLSGYLRISWHGCGYG